MRTPFSLSSCYTVNGVVKGTGVAKVKKVAKEEAARQALAVRYSYPFALHVVTVADSSLQALRS
jgi:hypothetical protein